MVFFGRLWRGASLSRRREQMGCGEGWRKQACEVLVRVRGEATRHPGPRDVSVACHALLAARCSSTLRRHRLERHRPRPGCAEPCPSSSRRSNCPLLFALYVAYHLYLSLLLDCKLLIIIYALSTQLRTRSTGAL